MPAFAIVKQSFGDREKVHPSGRIMKLDKACPWKEPLFDLEKEVKKEGEVLFALYGDSNDKWRVQAVPKDLSSF